MHSFSKFGAPILSILSESYDHVMNKYILNVSVDELIFFYFLKTKFTGLLLIFLLHPFYLRTFSRYLHRLVLICQSLFLLLFLFSTSLSGLCHNTCSSIATITFFFNFFRLYTFNIYSKLCGNECFRTVQEWADSLCCALYRFHIQPILYFYELSIKRFLE